MCHVLHAAQPERGAGRLGELHQQPFGLEAANDPFGRIRLVMVDLDVGRQVDLQVAEAALEDAAAPPLLVDRREAQAARIDPVRRVLAGLGIRG